LPFTATGAARIGDPEHGLPERRERDVQAHGKFMPSGRTFRMIEAAPGPGMTAAVYELRREPTSGAWSLRRDTG
jgi:hypothetical protein